MTGFDPRRVPGFDRLELRVRRLARGSYFGLHRSPFKGAAIEFAEYRPYLPGDALRDLDWRVYARTDRLYVKSYEKYTNLTAQLLLDVSASMGFAAKWEAALLLAGAAACVMIDQGDRVGLVCCGAAVEEHEPRRGSAHGRHLLQLMEQAVPGGDTPVGPALDARLRRGCRGGLYLLISDFLSDDLAALAATLRRARGLNREVLALHLVSRQELQLAGGPAVEFVDPETGDRVEAPPDEIFPEYQKRFQDHLRSVAELFRACEFDHQLIVAEDDPGAAFSRFLRAHNRRCRRR